MNFSGPPIKHVIVVVGFGAGVLIGCGATWWLFTHRIDNNLRHLNDEVRSLSRKIDLLQQCIQQTLLLKHSTQQLRINAEQEEYEEDDDDDLFQDAFNGASVDDSTSVHDDVNTNISSEASFFTEIDRLFDGNDQDRRAAFEQLIKLRYKLSDDARFLWRLSKATHFMSQYESIVDKQRQKSFAYEALNYATQALQLDDNSPDVHKWYAITLGSIGDYESVTVKIRNGFVFKAHIEKAIHLNPRDPTVHYLLGRWCFAVYMLSWVERKMAATLFAVPPTATVDEALGHFVQADNLNPGKWKENLLFIAKCYIQKRDYTNAVAWLEKADQVPVHGHDDELYQKEVISLLQQYSLYRQ